MSGTFSVKNFEKFQHYKDRNPPWIKLHRALLDDYEFARLQDASKAHLMLLWLLASQLNNKIPDDPKWIKNRLGLTAVIDIKLLEEKGFLILMQDASTPLAKCSPEREAEAERERPPIPPKVSKMIFMEPPPGWLAEAMDEKGWPQNVAEDVWSNFREYWQNGKGRNTKRGDWSSTWRTWYRKENINMGAANGKSNKRDGIPTKDDRARAAVMRAAQAGGFAPTG